MKVALATLRHDASPSPSPSPSQKAKSHIKKKENSEPIRMNVFITITTINGKSEMLHFPN